MGDLKKEPVQPIPSDQSDQTFSKNVRPTFWGELAQQISQHSNKDHLKYFESLIDAIAKYNIDKIIRVLFPNADISPNSKSLTSDEFENTRLESLERNYGELLAQPISFAIKLCNPEEINSSGAMITDDKRYTALFLLGKHFRRLNEILEHRGLSCETLEDIITFATKEKKPHALDSFVLGLSPELQQEAEQIRKSIETVADSAENDKSPTLRF